MNIDVDTFTGIIREFMHGPMPWMILLLIAFVVAGIVVFYKWWEAQKQAGAL